MRHKISVSFIRLSILAVALWCGVLTASAQTTAFSYQGQLNDGGGPANGSYDLQFKLFDALTTGTQVSSTVSLTSIAVSNGIFTVTLDFGASAFPGANRWLEISVRLAGGGSFTALTPRQPLTSTPYAIKSLSTATADGLSAACVGCVSGTQIGSLPTGSGNYIQNTTTLQTANFNISGNGFIGGNVGIGLGGTNPLRKLHVSDANSNLLFGNEGGSAVMRLTNSAPSSIAALNLGNTARDWQLRINGSDANKFSIYDATAIAYRLIIDTNGNVGIGGNPLTKLDIQGSDSSFNGVALRLFNANAGNTNQWVLGTGGATVAKDAFSIGDSTFYRMTILSNGNVGIGSTTPSSKLTVVATTTDAVQGTTSAAGTSGVAGFYNGTNAKGFGMFGRSDASQGSGVWGYTENRIGVYGSAATFPASDIINSIPGPIKAGVAGFANLDAGSAGYSAGVYGKGVGCSDCSGQLPSANRGVVGESESGEGVVGSGTTGVFGISANSFGAGVSGLATGNKAHGVLGQAYGNEANGVFGKGFGFDSVGVQGVANNGPNAYGVWGISSSGQAGVFWGNVGISGNLSKGGGSFKIDHPLDPENKYLYHSFVESPEMMNIYNGNITTNAEGEAIVTMPDYFEALNRDFRYQLTVIGQFAQAIVANKINGNSFTLKTDKPNVEVSWQVTGVRQDAYANKHRIQVEEAKPERERGTDLYPEVFGQPEEKGVEWARHPEMMRKMKEQREKSQQPNQSQQR